MNLDKVREATLSIVVAFAKAIERTDDSSRVAFAKAVRRTVARVYPVGTLCRVDRPQRLPIRESALRAIHDNNLLTVESVVVGEDDILMIVQEPTLAIIDRPGIFIEKSKRVIDIWLEVTTSRVNDRLFVPFDVVSYVRSRRTQR